MVVRVATLRRAVDAVASPRADDRPPGRQRPASVIRRLAGPALLVAASAAFPLVTATGGAGATTTAPVPQDRNVREIYLADCAVCHGSDGRGTARGPTLVGVGKASHDYYLTTGRMPLVAAGRSEEPGRAVKPLPDRDIGDPDELPRRHEPAYPPETIKALVEYIPSLVGGGGPDIPKLTRGDVAEGGTLFNLQCAACHAWAGNGGALLHREAPDIRPAEPLQVAEAIRVGPGQMPSFGEAALTDEQVASIVDYVEYLRDPDDRGGQPLWHLGPVAEGGIALAALAALLLLCRWIGDRG